MLAVSDAYQQKRNKDLILKNNQKATVIPVGSYVFAEWLSQPPTKFAPKWRGPFRVVEVLSEGNRLRIQHLNTNDIETVFITSVKPMIIADDAPLTDNQMIALASLDTMDPTLDHIVSHHYYGKGHGAYGPQLSKYDFLVFWKNDPTPTWQSYADLRDTAALNEYLFVNPLILEKATPSQPDDESSPPRNRHNPNRKVLGRALSLEGEV